MKYLIFLLSLGLLGCREFYDEDFEEDNVSESQFTEQNYKSLLVATDPTQTQLTGEALVTVKNGEVKVNVSVSGIPQNILQVFYSYGAFDCGQFNTSLPTELGDTRSYQINELSSTEALFFDLQANGVVTSSENLDLSDYSFIVKGFSSYAGAGGSVGTESLFVACGPLNVTSEEAQ